ncbi:hypothetical protein C0995_016165 [Termitomyces sp. Mi166|nr:hypothetical protein C0995_016165 [Termitomyces sp. Mi166\
MLMHRRKIPLGHWTNLGKSHGTISLTTTITFPFDTGPHPILPAELINAILEEVATDIDVETYSGHFASTLLDCSLVSSHFRDTAQKLLFYDAIIHFSDSEDKLHLTVKKALISSNRLRAFVKKLSVVVYPTVIDEPYVSLPIPTLPNLTYLKIDGGKSDFLLNWSLVRAKECGSDILKMIRAPGLRALEIRDIEDFPLAILNTRHRLKELSVDSSIVLSNVTDTTNALLSTPGIPRQQKLERVSELHIS